MRDLYLAPDTLNAMRERDKACPGKDYRRLRNAVSSMVKRDRLQGNRRKLLEANGDPRVAWDLAKQALGLSTHSSLPKSLHTPSGTCTSGLRR